MVLLDLQTIFMVNSMDLVHVDHVCQIHRQAADHLVMVSVDNPLVDQDLQGRPDHLYLLRARRFLLLVRMVLLLV